VLLPELVSFVIIDLQIVWPGMNFENSQHRLIEKSKAAGNGSLAEYVLPAPLGGLAYNIEAEMHTGAK